MKKSKQIQKVITKLVKASFKEGKLLESQVIKSIKILKGQSTLEAIWVMSKYLKELKSKQREHTMFIETTVPLSINQLKRIKKIVEKKVKITKVVTNINHEILGGFKLQVGDEVWDESILGKIDQVKEAIVHGRPN